MPIGGIVAITVEDSSVSGIGGIVAISFLLIAIIASAIEIYREKNQERREPARTMNPEIEFEGDGDSEELLRRELEEVRGDWQLPDLKDGYTKSQLAEAQASAIETYIASLKGRFKAGALMKYRNTVIALLSQEKELALVDRARIEAIVERLLVKEDLKHTVTKRRKDHELDSLKTDYEILKVKKKIEDFTKPAEPEVIEVVDEEQQLYDQVAREVGRKAKQEIFKQTLRSEKVEEALKEKQKRKEEIEDSDLPPEDKERLKQELEENIDYMIRRIYEERREE